MRSVLRIALADAYGPMYSTPLRLRGRRIGTIAGNAWL